MDKALLAYLNTIVSDERQLRFNKVLANRTRLLTVAVEDVFQMHNTSAVIRSCEVFGVQDAHLIELRNRNELDKNIALGAEKWVDTHMYTSSLDCINSLRSKGYTIVATSPHAEASNLEDFVVKGKTALFFGTERDGLSDVVLSNADSFLKIPMLGFTESLNISVSAAIILQILSRQIRDNKLNWELTNEEKLEKQLDWAKKSIKSIDSILDRYYAGSIK